MKISFKKGILIFVTLVVAVMAFISLFAYLKATKRYDGSNGEAVMVYIPRNATESMMADSLNKTLGLDFGSTVVDVWRKLPNVTVRSGAYEVHVGDKAIDVAKRLRNARQTPVEVKLPVLRKIEDLSKKVDAQMDISAEEFLAAADSILTARGVPAEQHIAYFIPDNYEFYWDSSAEGFVNRLLDYHDKFWNEERQAKAEALGLTPAEVVTLASIVYGETKKADEQPLVARLYLNRLEKGMKLQADPTVVYSVGDFSINRVLGTHLKVDSPYNTYKYAGLPPGPISMTEKSVIDAVLNAPEHNYIYMCADEKRYGYHNFAADYSTHQANARRYQAYLNRRGITGKSRKR